MLKAAVSILLLAVSSSTVLAEDKWTPDPRCPYPSDVVTRYPYPGDCSKYWECFQGARYPMDCPTGLEFNYPLQQCDAPEIAHCDPTADPDIPTQPVGPTEPAPSEPTREPDSFCPYPSDEITFFPYPGDCTKFYECYQGQANEYTCPPNLYWNQPLHQCDYLENVDCDATAAPIDPTVKPDPQPSSGTVEPDPQPTSDTEKPDSSICAGLPTDQIAFLPHPDDCAKYYECFAGHADLMTCPDGLYWNQPASACDYLENVNCDATPAPINPTVKPDPQPSPDTAVVTLLVLALFNASVLAEDKWTPDPRCPYPSEVVTRYPYPGDCTKYWECFEGARYPMDCPAGLEFNYPLQQCDAPEIANCDPTADPDVPTQPIGPTDPAPTEPTKGPDSFCPYPSDEITFFPCPEDCTKFYECYQGQANLYTCPPNLYWNQAIHECDYLENVDCDATVGPVNPTEPDGPTNPTTIEPTKGPDSFCPYPSDEITFFPCPEDCTKFYECYQGQANLYTCPPDLYWNQAIHQCDYLENVDCDATVAPVDPTDAPNTDAPNTDEPNTDEPDTAEPPTVCAGQPADQVVFLPYPDDCTKYYECYGGRGDLMSCPDGLFWNEPASVCDFECVP